MVNATINQLHDIVHDKFLTELTIRFNKRFNTECTQSSIEHKASRLGCRNGRCTLIQPGQRTVWNYHPKYTITLNRHYEGRYLYWIKYKDDIYAHDNWIPLHQFLWNINYGKPPDGMRISFKDRNTMNCRLSNLMLVHRNRSLEEYSDKLEKANEKLCQGLDRVGACTGKYIECKCSCIDCWKEVSLSHGRN